MKTIDQRVMELEQAANTVSAVTINALGALIRVITKLPEVDRDALMADLEHAKAVQIQNGNQAGYVEILNILQRNIF